MKLRLVVKHVNSSISLILFPLKIKIEFQFFLIPFKMRSQPYYRFDELLIHLFLDNYNIKAMKLRLALNTKTILKIHQTRSHPNSQSSPIKPASGSKDNRRNFGPRAERNYLGLSRPPNDHTFAKTLSLPPSSLPP